MAPDLVPFDIMSLALGATLGLVLAIIVGIMPVLRLIREKAELAAKLGSEQESRDRITSEFHMLAQDALKSSQEQFLILAGEKLKAAQNDGAHDLEKRQSAIAEMVKPLQKQ